LRRNTFIEALAKREQKKREPNDQDYNAQQNAAKSVFYYGLTFLTARSWMFLFLIKVRIGFGIEFLIEKIMVYVFIVSEAFEYEYI
jgi:hypothetical protein